MAQSKFCRAPRFENLESREMLSTVGSSLEPTNDEQLMLQLLNQARTNPAAAAQEIANNLTPDIQATLQYYKVNLQATLQNIATANPEPPLAWNYQLAQAAQAHSQDMATNGFQSHNGSDGTSPGQRIQQSGYTNSSSNAENAYAYSSSVQQAMEAFLIDWGVTDDGHRVNIQQPGVLAQNAYRDVGIGLATTGAGSPVGPMVVTQDFAAKPNEQAQLVGVAYNDPNSTGFYSYGQGVGYVQISAVNVATGQVTSTQTWKSGGYEMSLPPGQYRVIASQNDQVIKSVNVTVSSVNAEQDFVLTDSWQNGSAQAAIAAAQPSFRTAAVTLPPVAVQPPVAPAISLPLSAITWNWKSFGASVGH